MNGLSQLVNFIVVEVFLLPSLEGMLSNVERLLPSIYPYYKNGTFHDEFIVYYKNLLREVVFLQGSPNPSTNEELQNDISDSLVLQQEYPVVISDYYKSFSTNCSTTCSNISIQVANCSCFTSPEVVTFLNDFVNIYAPTDMQVVDYFAKELTPQTDNEEIVSDALLAATHKVQTDSTQLYQEIYSNNGNVNETDIAARLTQISADIHAYAASFTGNIVNITFTGEPL